MNRKQQTIVIGVVILLIFSFLNNIFAEIKEVKVGIDGLSCPFCVWGLKRQMKKIEMVDQLNISLKKSTARFTLKENRPLNIEKINVAVKNAGFSVREIKITAIGEIGTYGEFFIFKVSEPEQNFVLDEKEKVQVGQKVLIEGTIHKHVKGELYGLSIDSIHFIEEEYDR